MTLHELLPILHNLSYADKLLVLQFLESEIASEEEAEQIKSQHGESCPVFRKEVSQHDETWGAFAQEPGSLRSTAEAFQAARALLRQQRAIAIKQQQQAETELENTGR